MTDYVTENRIVSRVGVLEPENNTLSEQEEKRARMRENLNRLLYPENYATEEKIEEVNEVKDVASEEDIRPTSTTLQFANGGDDVLNEMRVSEGEKQNYKLNAKGKVAVFLYAISIAVIFALIIFNTGLLATLTKSTEAKSAELGELNQTYMSKIEEINEISSDAHVSEIAENQLNMIIK